ncbi:MAG: protease complex subunit PrcB family protein [Flavobacteriales bacterium]|nr:protease complex subunit PrcB family protein [Flavobacteriales bacterium]MCB9364505.1 protease complex subunit PrcB family protein [Flavobacteriales bacterium]
MKYLTLILSIVLVSCANTKNTTPPSKEITFSSIKKSNNSGFENPRTQVIVSQVEFEKAWKQAWSRFSDAPQLPTIDFNKKQVLLIALGAKNNGGYGLKIENVTQTKNEITVNYFETKAGEKCMSTQAIVFPFEIIEIEKTAKKVVFKSTEKIIDCK